MPTPRQSCLAVICLIATLAASMRVKAEVPQSDPQGAPEGPGGAPPQEVQKEVETQDQPKAGAAQSQEPEKQLPKEDDPNYRPENGYWSVGRPRLFFTTRSELGTPYLKPYISVGYGLPHWIWTGIDVNSIITMDTVQLYAGVRAATPILDFALGIRDTWSLDKPFFMPKASFNASDIDNASGKHARFWAWEGEVVGIVPLPYAAIVGDLIGIKAIDVPKDRYWYDESYRAIIGDDFYFVMRVAGVARFLHESALKVGWMVEHVFATGRGEPVTRMGPVGSLQLTDHLEINGALTLAVSGPDHLGIVHGTYGVAGVRYRWATGERAPKAPWEGLIIP